MIALNTNFMRSLEKKARQDTLLKEQLGESTPKAVDILPPPEILARYNEAVPTAAARILSLAERCTAHREGIEKAIVEAGIKDQRLRVFFAFGIAVLAIGGGIYLIAIDRNGYGIAAIISSLVPLSGLFLKK